MAEPSSASAFDSAAFRTVCGRFATGVAVVTAQVGDEVVGLAVNSFTSVSLDPPLVLFCAARSSATWPVIRQAGSFAVNFLAADQEAVSRAFASKDGDRFADVSFRVGVTGSPVLDGAVAYLDCDIEAVYPGGDHEIVVGRVLDLAVQREVEPLVFHRGGYGRLS